VRLRKSAKGAEEISRQIDGAVIHYAPTENLEHIDVALIDVARHEIDMAAYVLTDWPILQALNPRRRSWRPYPHLQLAEREPANAFRDLAATPGVEIESRVHRRADAPQELPNRRAVAAHRRRELFRLRT
jgi:hypothetical protein